MPSYKTAFGSYLKTEDLQGRPVRVQIETVQVEDVKSDDGVEKKLIVHFIGKDKTLILNRTNCEMLEQLTGSDDYDQWGGAVVTLYPTTTRFGAKTVPCLRIRAPLPSAAPVQAYMPPPPPAGGNSGMVEEDEIPF